MSYLGCYTDFPHSQPGSHEMDYMYEGIDPYDCVLGCKGLDAEYAWLSYYGSQCFCSKSPPQVQHKAVETVCNNRCRKGNAALACGAEEAYSVYQGAEKFGKVNKLNSSINGKTRITKLSRQARLTWYTMLTHPLRVCLPFRKKISKIYLRRILVDCCIAC